MKQSLADDLGGMPAHNLELIGFFIAEVDTSQEHSMMQGRYVSLYDISQYHRGLSYYNESYLMICQSLQFWVNHRGDIV